MPSAARVVTCARKVTVFAPSLTFITSSRMLVFSSVARAIEDKFTSKAALNSLFDMPYVPPT